MKELSPLVVELAKALEKAQLNVVCRVLGLLSRQKCAQRIGIVKKTKKHEERYQQNFEDGSGAKKSLRC